jgi:hypothetical protein
LHHGDHLNHHAPANLRDDGPYWDQMRVLKMGGQMKKMRDGWMGAMIYRVPNLRVPVYHPFRTPLF